MLSEEQYKRLPQALQDIVVVDRKLAAPVIEWTEGRRLLTLRKRLRAAAERDWGHKPGGEGSRRG